MRLRSAIGLGLITLVAVLIGTPAQATVPIGPQIRVSQIGVDGDPARGASRGPGVAYNPQATEYLVVWNGDGLATDNEFEVFGQRLSAAGAELGGDFRISTTGSDGDAGRGAFGPAVAYGAQANEYLVVWSGDGLATDQEFEVFGQRLSASGAELGGDFRISTTGSDGDAARDAFNPAVAYNAQANEYLVVWEGDGLATNEEREVFGQRLSAAGAELGGDFRISTTGGDGDAARDASDPAVAYSAQANEYLVAWTADGLAIDDEQEIFARRIGEEPPPPPPAGPCTITGTPGNDVLRGTPGPDRICALGGNDRVFGLGGDDRIVLGPGRDRAFGGGGRDVILGGTGADRISGGKGRDRLFGQPGRDVLLARDRVRDLVHGGKGFDRARIDRRRDVRRSIERLF